MPPEDQEQHDGDEPKTKAGDMHSHESKFSKEALNDYVTRMVGIDPSKFENFIESFRENELKVPIPGGASPSTASPSYENRSLCPLILRRRRQEIC
jgi:hypothetical protein